MEPPVLLAGAAAAGIATHVLYLNRSEHHLYGVRYLQLAFVVFCVAVAGLVRIGEAKFADAFATVLAYEGSFFAGLYTSLLIYRAFLNPLNKFPGPYPARKFLIKIVFLIPLHNLPLLPF